MVEQDPISIAASLAAVDHRHHVVQYGGREILKFMADLDRYELLIAETRPELIIETGTYTGGSAAWFADQPGVQQVITIDTYPHELTGLWAAGVAGVLALRGQSSTDPETVDQVSRLAAGRRTMVVLDSDHTAGHVASEIELYGPLVTPGCALVVEDGLFDHATAEMLRRWGMPELIDGNGPGKAVRDRLDAPEWRRADGLVVDSQLTQNVDGWWIRNG